MVEAPHVQVATKRDDDDAADRDGDDDEDHEEKGQLLPDGASRSTSMTSSIRRTLAHLRRVAGFRRGFFRGAPHLVLYFLASLPFRASLTLLLPTVVSEPLSNLLPALLLSTLHAATTHAVISTTPKSFFRRFPPIAAWKHLAIPTAVYGTAEYLTFLLPTLTTMALGLDDQSLADPKDMLMGSNRPRHQEEAHLIILLSKFAIIMAVSGISGLLFTLPASAALTRVEASLLPETESTVVSLDPALGKKGVERYGDGETRKSALPEPVGLLEAWRSLSWSALRRTLWLGFKVLVVLTVLEVVFLLITALAAGAILKDVVAIILGEFVRQSTAQDMLVESGPM